MKPEIEVLRMIVILRAFGHTEAVKAAEWIADVSDGENVYERIKTLEVDHEA